MITLRDWMLMGVVLVGILSLMLAIVLLILTLAQLWLNRKNVDG